MTARRCACGCGASLDGLRADATYASEACSKRARRAASPDKGRTEHPLVEAREAQEATKLKDHYSQVIYQGIVERLERGPVHADDLEDLFPDSDRTICRKLVGAQFGSLASRHYIHEVERRKSSVPSRKGAKSGVFEFTRLGREKLAGTGTRDERAEGARVDGERAPGLCRTASRLKSPSARSGDRSTAGVPSPQGPGEVSSCASLRASADPGGGSSVHGRQPTHGAGEPRPTNETLSLLPEPPKLLDHDQPRAA